MLFNSLEFLLFFPLVCIVYYALRNNRGRIPFLLVASYLFYMNWKPTYALLILTSTLITYTCGLLLAKAKSHRKGLLATGIVLNLAILFFFKYFNFLSDSITAGLQYTGLRFEVPRMDVLLPVGISFYTFQALGYIIDVYRGTIKAERSFVHYALFVSFFPQLVAGPIERAANLLPQFYEEHRFDRTQVVEGLRMMLWGYFMKVCVADVAAEYVDEVYGNIALYNGTTLFVSAVLFTIQIYCDFGGYSLIARGAARVMGFRLMENFRRPYLADSVKEFWKRWHISLSTWFMDYLYIPLGGNRKGLPRQLFNLMVTFVVSGLWHGADWTFVLWGMWHGVFIILDTLLRRAGIIGKRHDNVTKAISIATVFLIVALGLVFFRANNIGMAITVLGKIFTDFGAPWLGIAKLPLLLSALAVLTAKDMVNEYLPGRRYGMHSRHWWVRYACYYLLLFWTLSLLSGRQAFIYFQF